VTYNRLLNQHLISKQPGGWLMDLLIILHIVFQSVYFFEIKKQERTYVRSTLMSRALGIINSSGSNEY